MSVQQYQDIRLQHKSLGVVRIINGIVARYVAQGLRLTARQIYYQLVAKHGLPNTERSYRNITRLINDAKLAGLMDWDAIEDRTRSFLRRSHWESGQEILDSSARSYHMDLWHGQPVRPFVIVEKEALVGVLERVCHDYDVPLLAARGYPSGSVLREFAISDVIPAFEQGQQAVIVHLGDHDPSGMDMSRDLDERIMMFGEHRGDIELDRIALNMKQITALKPPPNPAKQTDARFKQYRDKFGSSSWELDALDPSYLSGIVKDRIEQEIIWSTWDKRKRLIKKIKGRIAKLAKGFK